MTAPGWFQAVGVAMGLGRKCVVSVLDCTVERRDERYDEQLPHEPGSTDFLVPVRVLHARMA